MRNIHARAVTCLPSPPIHDAYGGVVSVHETTYTVSCARACFKLAQNCPVVCEFKRCCTWNCLGMSWRIRKLRLDSFAHTAPCLRGQSSRRACLPSLPLQLSGAPQPSRSCLPGLPVQLSRGPQPPEPPPWALPPQAAPRLPQRLPSAPPPPPALIQGTQPANWSIPHRRHVYKLEDRNKSGNIFKGTKPSNLVKNLATLLYIKGSLRRGRLGQPAAHAGTLWRHACAASSWPILLRGAPP